MGDSPVDKCEAVADLMRSAAKCSEFGVITPEDGHEIACIGLNALTLILAEDAQCDH